MDKFAIGDQADWCTACGNTTGICASTSTATSSSASATATGGISKAVAGFIGAMVTLAVILGVEALIMLIGGMRLASKKRLAAGAASPTGSVVHRIKA